MSTATCGAVVKHKESYAKLNQQKTRKMARITNYITALWLIIYLPKIAYLWVCEHWKMLATAIVCTLALFVVSYTNGKSETTATTTAHTFTATAYDGGGFGFEDLTAAFATGDYCK